jgi:hypothetical protein
MEGGQGMLILVLPQDDTNEALELRLEHSLVSLSKWESIHEKAFFGREEAKTEEETISYVQQMVLNKTPPGNFTDRLNSSHYQAINEYINSKQTATWFNELGEQKASREVVTAELIYYWMLSFQIPFSCEEWHLNRLMTLIKICGIKQTKPKPMSKAAQMEQYARLNAERRQKLGTTG